MESVERLPVGRSAVQQGLLAKLSFEPLNFSLHVLRSQEGQGEVLTQQVGQQHLALRSGRSKVVAQTELVLDLRQQTLRVVETENL